MVPLWLPTATEAALAIFGCYLWTLPTAIMAVLAVTCMFGMLPTAVVIAALVIPFWFVLVCMLPTGSAVLAMHFVGHMFCRLRSGSLIWFCSIAMLPTGNAALAIALWLVTLPTVVDAALAVFCNVICFSGCLPDLSMTVVARVASYSCWCCCHCQCRGIDLFLRLFLVVLGKHAAYSSLLRLPCQFCAFGCDAAYR
jgi:hypothetical protein